MSQLTSRPADEPTDRPADKLVVMLSRDGGYARIRLASYAGPGRFADFRKAIEGAKYDFQKKVNLAPLDKVPAILNRLRDTGFEARYEGGSDLHEVLLERTAQQWLDLKSVQERIERIDAEIYKQTGKRLFGYQKTGAQWLTLRHGALLADDPGTGKTLQVLVSLPANAPVLVVGPAAAKGVWVGEVENWRSQLPVRMLSGRDSFRWPKPGSMLVTNYDILPDVHKDGCTGFLPLPPTKPCPGCLEELVFHNGKTMTVTKHGAHEAGCSGTLPQPEPTPCPGCHPMLKEVPIGMVLVADEAHALKNGQALRTKRFRALSRVVREKEGRCWLVTGTPMENEPNELWGVLDAAGLAQEAFGSFKNFVALFKGKPRMFGSQRAGYEWGTPDGDVAERLQRVSLRRRAEDVLPELPDLLWREVVVDVDLAAIAECDAFVERSGGIAEIAQLLSQEKIPFDKMSKILTVLAVAKYKAALEIVKEHEKHGEPLLVFSMHREPIDKLAKRKGWLTITGDVPPEKRFAIAERFQDPKEGIKGIACMIQAAGVALTMHRACHELFIDRSWNPKMNEQAAKRAHRIGQRKSVVATVLRANHLLDKHLQNMLAKKSRLFVDSVDAAAVLDDAPPCLDQDFEAIVRRTQEEISLGRAVRRMADTDEQKATVERIHRVVFVRASDERLARQLGEEALAIGLSGAQWDLAARVAARGREPEEHAQALDEEKAKEAKKAKEEQKPIGKKKEVAKAIEPATRLPHREEIDMEKIEQAFGEIAALSDDERDVLFDLIGAEDPVDVAKIETIAKRVLALNERSRDALLGKLHEAGFMGDLDDDDDDDEDKDTEDDGDDEGDDE